MNVDERIKEIRDKYEDGLVDALKTRELLLPSARKKLYRARNKQDDAIKQLIRDVIKYVTPDGEDTAAPGVAGAFNSGFNSALRRVRANAKELVRGVW